ncbi:MAG: C25 family cysteine peptidase, partial [Candidatus Cloacimonetes bacterium]|nr:C25 family cysteine peptidase [Candidatus Cloacimonadota bacterium]
MGDKIVYVLVCFFLFSAMYAELREIELSEFYAEIEILENNSDRLQVKFSYDRFQTMEVETDLGVFNELIIPGAFSVGELGYPKLPAFNKLIEIPFGAEVDVNLISAKEKDIKLAEIGIVNRIFPVQPSLAKNIDSKNVKFEFSEKAYSQIRFPEQNPVSIEILGVMRGVRIARLTVAPVSYNPSAGELKVLNDIEVEVAFRNVNLAEQQRIKQSTWSPYFEDVYDRLLNRLNDRHDYPAHPDLITYPVKYLIVSPRMFEETLEPFIEWKTKKGFQVTVGYTDTIGTTVSSIRTWIHNQYNAGTPQNPAPSFVLFVGDVAQIPASETGSSTQEVTDLYYCSVDGDMFPEMYWGRFSATTTAQLQPIITKTLYYEQYQFADPTYLDNVTLIAGADEDWNPNVGQPTIHYGTQNYFNTAHGFNDVNTYLTSYTGCYDTINSGIGFINYTAHGSTTSWHEPYLSVSNVNSLTNVNKPTFAIGNCCITGQFNVGECFGESWTRAANGG